MLYYGVDYYPEHWPESRWAEDARLMAEAGFNVVRLAEFAWALLEPAEGVFDFAWLDRAIALLADHGMQVVLGTPTASPPPWLMARDPSLFRVLLDGRRVEYGLRREYCPNHAGYHEAARRIVGYMAEHYGQHPAVIGWQIDNEFGDRCYCPVCRAAFQTWLQRRYGTLEAVNEQWGTSFWSHCYSAWDQIPAPSAAAWPPNPGFGLDYARFCSDSYVAFQQEQIDLLRAASPGRFITHNFMGFGYDQINYFDLARPLDLVAWDNYPRLQWNMDTPFDPALPALGHDTMRGLKRQAFWVMEQQAGPAGWDILGPSPRPGQLRLWVYQAIAHGADGILFFRWRTAMVGAEQNWHGVLDHHGQLGRRYEEIRRTGAELKALSDLLAGTQPKPQVGILLSYDSRFAFQIQRHNPGFDYAAHASEIYRALYRLHVPVDLVDPTADLAEYPVLIAPALHVVDETIAANLRRFVGGGGNLLVTARSGVKDAFNRVSEQRLPGLLSSMAGATVDEYISLPKAEHNAVRFATSEVLSDNVFEVNTWCEILLPDGADVLARYERDFFAGSPAITAHRFGAGRVIYCGVFGDQELLQPLLHEMVRSAGVTPLATQVDGLEVVERQLDRRSILFVLNHSEETRELPLEASYVDVLTGRPAQHHVAIAPLDLAILLHEKGGLP